MDDDLTTLRHSVRAAAADYERVAKFCAAILPYSDAVSLPHLIQGYHYSSMKYRQALQALLARLAEEDHTPEVVSEMNQLIRDGIRLSTDVLKTVKQVYKVWQAFTDEATRRAGQPRAREGHCHAAACKPATLL
jgi:hypothetical protein